jgi:hypothetical protein
VNKIEATDTSFARGLQARWIREQAPGLSFADVGGLWGTVGEKVTTAYQAKCRAVTMIDAMPQRSEWWEKFFVHAEQKGVPRSAIEARIADLEKENFPQLAGTHDFVNCAGVLYHVPNPLNVMRNLSLIAGRFLAITTQVVPERIVNASGVIEVPAGQALFIPSLTPGQKAVLKQFYDENNYKVTHVNRDGPPFFKDGKFNYGPSFWLPTQDMVVAWIRIFGLEVIDSGLLSPHSAAFLARRN